MFHRDIPELRRFCDLVCNGSHTTSETERLSAVRALQVAGATVLDKKVGCLSVR